MSNRTSFAAAMDAVHRRLAASGISAPQIAREAELKSANTVRNFLRTGAAHARTIRAIDEALDRLLCLPRGHGGTVDAHDAQ